MILPGNYTRDLLRLDPGEQVTAHGWVTDHRPFKKFTIIKLNDGSSPVGLQVVIDVGAVPDEVYAQLNIGACLSVEGELVPSKGKEQPTDLIAHKVTLHGPADPSETPLA